MRKIYIIVGSSGSYEDVCDWNECAYLDKYKAEEELIGLNEDLNKRKELNESKLNTCNGNDINCTEECETCEWNYDYDLNEQHNYRLVECELR